MSRLENNSTNVKIGKVFTKLANVAHYLRDAGHVDEAISCLETLAYGDETYDCGDYAFELGLCYLKKNDPQKANEYFKIAVEQNPEWHGPRLKEIGVSLVVSSDAHVPNID